MAQIELEVSFTKRIETTYSGTIEIDVPDDVIETDGILDWLDKKYDSDAKIAKIVDDAVSEDDSSEEAEWEYAERTDED